MAEYINSKWRNKFGKKGICDFNLNYRFYFKWLLNKVMNCFIISGGDDDFAETVNKSYAKMNLILDGMICFTDFDGKGGKTGNHLYCCVGNIGTEPDEYYVPVGYTISNPILGSKTVFWRDFKGHEQNGVLVFNTAIDKYSAGVEGFDCGLFGLIHQTATLLADNIVSINCCQINTRVQTLFTADSEAQQVAAENILKELYAGTPFKVLRQDLVKKITITPTANASTSQSITELVELNNYIIANFFKAIGVESNNNMKRERLVVPEVAAQNAFISLSLTEMLEAWTRGFNEVNDFYGTDFAVELNPVIARTLVESVTSGDAVAPVDDNVLVGVEDDATVPDDSFTEQEGYSQPDQPPVLETLQEQAEVVNQVAECLVGGISTDTQDEETTEEESEEVESSINDESDTDGTERGETDDDTKD